MLDMSQYMKVFVEEAREHVENLNRVLLEWEQEPEDESKVPEVFRIAHTLKGMAATMELEDITVLCHHLETLLDQMRVGEIEPEGRIFDTLLTSVDALEQLINKAEGGNGGNSKQVQVVVEQITGLLTQSAEMDKAPQEVKEEPGFNEHERFILSKAGEEGLTPFKIEVWLQTECLLKRARVYLILQNLEQIGEIIKTVPVVEELEEENFGDHFTVYLVSRKDREAITETMGKLAEIKEFEIIPIGPVGDREPGGGKGDRGSPKTSNGSAEQLPGKGPVSSRQTVRVGIDRLDQLMNLVGELVITKTRIEQILAAHGGNELEETLKGLGRISSSLQDVVMQARMIPVAQVFNRFPRMVRDLAKDLGKEVNLAIKGEDTELDRRVIDELAEPLVHLIRNAIDHGLESPGARVEAGKPAAGNLELEAYYQGNSVVIEIRDDGRGMSIQQLRQKALDMGIIASQEVSELAEEELLDLVFASGFSTADQVSSISGRGVGLDAVRAKIESLNGTIGVKTDVGQGTSFRIKLPLTLAIIQALLIKVGSEIYALPLERVEEIRRSKDLEVKGIQGKEVINLRGDVLPLVRAKGLLRVPGEEESKEEFFTVVVDTGQQQVALVVDALMGQQEIVIKSLGKLLARIPGLAGATILGDGKVALILDVGFFAAEVDLD